MSEKIILLGSIIFGAVGGIAWSELPSTGRPTPHLAPAAPAVHVAAPPAGAAVEVPAVASADDRAWASRGSRASSRASSVPQRQMAGQQAVHYSGCNEVRALGKAPLYADQPGYREDMDGDGDGIACEPHRAR